jgi:hypothetical protein
MKPQWHVIWTLGKKNKAGGSNEINETKAANQESQGGKPPASQTGAASQKGAWET